MSRVVLPSQNLLLLVVVCSLQKPEFLTEEFVGIYKLSTTISLVFFIKKAILPYRSVSPRILGFSFQTCFKDSFQILKNWHKTVWFLCRYVSFYIRNRYILKDELD